MPRSYFPFVQFMAFICLLSACEEPSLINITDQMLEQANDQMHKDMRSVNSDLLISMDQDIDQRQINQDQILDQSLTLDQHLPIIDMTRLEDQGLINDFLIDAEILDQDATDDLLILPDQEVDQMLVPISRDCMPALSLLAPQGYSLPFGLVIFRAMGGTGQYRFEFVQNQSGAILNSYTGVYLAGNGLAGTDIVKVTDEGCDGSASASIEVVAPIQVKPANISIGLGQHFQFETTLGSQQYIYHIRQNQSGATITEGGLYTAGNVIGIDQVEIEDLGTHELNYISINVIAESMIKANLEHLILGKQSKAQILMEGGSQQYESHWESSDASASAIQLNQLIIEAQAEGEGDVVVRDRFLGIETRVKVTVVDSLKYEGNRIGKAQAESHLISLGDLNEDQLEDFALALGETDVGALESGAVYLYHQGENTPFQVLTTSERQARFGRNLFAEDLNGDGKKDLLIGAHTADNGTSLDNGALYLYYAKADGTYPALADQIFYGQAGDQLGSSVTACDFNGDGRKDIAIGAPAAELLTANNSQGEISLFLGNADGFLNVADQVIQGKALNNQAQWQDLANLRIGTQLSCADLDLDGYAELIVGVVFSTGLLGRSDDGAVHIHKGVGPIDLNRGGVTDLPVLAIAGDESTSPNARLSFRMHVSDVNQDQKPDLLVTQPRHHYFKPNGMSMLEIQDAGAVRLFTFNSLPNSIAQYYTSVTTATKTWIGDSGFDNFGMDLYTKDINSDGMIDLIVGATADENPVMGALDGTGVVRIYLGQADGYPANDPSMIIPGLARFDIFGESVLLLSSQQAVVFAGRNNDLGPEVGRPYLITDLTMPVLSPLEMPGDIAGANFGISMGSGDWNGDGYGDIVVGASQLAPPLMPEIRAGTAFLYEGSAQTAGLGVVEGLGFINPNPTRNFQAFDTVHSSDDALGHEVGNIGDFDGDGYEDMALVARTDERPTTFPTNYIAEPSCLARSNTGAVYIFRGSAQGLLLKPSYAFYGLVNSQAWQKLPSAPVDLNGDGRKDLVIGSPEWDIVSNDGTGSITTNDIGGFSVFYGRSSPPTDRTIAICTADFTWTGTRASEQLAYSLSGVKDLNLDGCDELLIGAQADTSNGLDRQGATYLLMGWGKASCGNIPLVYSFARADRDARLGSSVAAGDLNGDGRDELVMTAYNHTVNNQRRGSAWVLDYDQFRNLLPTTYNGLKTYLEINSMAQRVDGIQNNERFGWQAMVRDQKLIVSAPYYQYTTFDALPVSLPRAGETRFFKNNAQQQINPNPYAIFIAENWSFDSQIGNRLSIGKIDQNRYFIGVSGQLGKGNYIDGGSAYVFELP